MSKFKNYIVINFAASFHSYEGKVYPGFSGGIQGWVNNLLPLSLIKGENSRESYINEIKGGLQKRE